MVNFYCSINDKKFVKSTNEKGGRNMKKKLLAISLVTIGCLYGVLAAIIILAFAIADLPISNGILLSLIILVIQFLIAPWMNDFVFKCFYKTEFDHDLPEYLKEFITESCKVHNMKYPKIGFIDDGSPNAFTYGRTKNDARVVITRGILELLNEEEVKAVVAHELGHVVHYDMMFMTVAQVVPLLLYYVYEILLERGSKSSSNSNDNDYGAIVGLIAYILYILSQYVILWLSRTREYYADSFSVEETKNPTALANALVKIGFGLSAGNKDGKGKSRVSEGNALGISNSKTSKGMAIGSYNNGGVSKENIINAMKWERWNVWAKLQELNSTHPLISKRLLAISDRCEEYGQSRYIEFNEKKQESYVDDFFKELLIASAPALISIIVLIVCFIIPENILMVLGFGGILFVLSLFVQLGYTHKNKGYTETNVAELLSEVKVSNVTSIPCILKGKVIGRGNPGCIFNEDFVLQDETGIIFLDYTQPLYVLEKFFALFKSEENFDKEVIIKGWYRRSVVPYVEIYSMEVDGKVKKCHTYKTVKVFYGILMIMALVAVVSSFLV